MKRFLLFRGADYYPSGGWRDFVCSFDSEIEAIKFLALPDNNRFTDWWQVVDSTTGEIVSHGP